MNIEYTLNENDLLVHQLFVASKSARIKKKRQRNRLIVPLVDAILGLYSLNLGNVFPAMVLFGFGLLWFFLYPLWEKRSYVSHYRGFIREHYKNRLGSAGSIAFAQDHITTKENGNESKIMYTELEAINEIPAYILIRLKSGGSLLLPKQRIAQIDHVASGLKALATQLNIPYEVDPQWEWK